MFVIWVSPVKTLAAATSRTQRDALPRILRCRSPNSRMQGIMSSSPPICHPFGISRQIQIEATTGITTARLTNVHPMASPPCAMATKNVRMATKSATPPASPIAMSRQSATKPS